MKARQLMCYIKEGYTPQDLCDKLNYSSEDELRSSIGRLYKKNPAKAEDLWRQLEANYKKPRRPKKEAVIVPVGNTSAGSSTDNYYEEQPEKETDEKTLSELKEEESSLSDEVMNIELSREEQLSLYRSRRKDLRELQSTIGEIATRLEECHNQYNEIIAQVDELATTINDLTSTRRDKKEELEKVRQIIEEKSTVLIFVNGNGVIEIPVNPEFIPDENGYLDIKSKIIEEEKYPDLTLREITTLARLLKICEKIERLDLTCDSKGVEEAFWAIRSQ